ncbi:MAG TPA: NAD(+)/NADH kinase [Dehalococcoidia bacterium]|nr:NAD(+)/NADH kinase [Dehalococcoidia bacterium]
MKSIGIIYNARIPEALDLGTTILHQLPLPEDSWISPAENLDNFQDRAENTKLVITVGGDGTILRAVQLTAPNEIPVVGVNMGRLGFMTELQVHEALEKLPFYINSDCRVEERYMIQATLVKANGGVSEVGPCHALNDVVLARGAVSRVVTITGYIDGAQLTTFRADAVILSTATGSTGYNLAVGGPILDIASDSLVLKPVAAHMGLTAALVLSAESNVELSLEGYQDATLSIDGYVDFPMEPGDKVIVKQSPYRARFLRANPPSHYYATLTRRLGVSIRGQ